MKKLLILFILISLINCSTLPERSKEKATISCPKVFFSLENNVYIDGDNQNLDFAKVNYKATLNNYEFSKNCISESSHKYFNLELLILAEPLNPKNRNINLPIFVLLYDYEDNLIGKQYFRVLDNLNYLEGTSNYEITEIVTNLDFSVETEELIGSMIIGFVNLN